MATLRFSVILCVIFLGFGVCVESYDDNQMDYEFAPMSSASVHRFLKPAASNSTLGTVDNGKECPEPETQTKCCTDDGLSCVCCRSNLYGCWNGACYCKNPEPCCSTLYYCRCCESCC